MTPTQLAAAADMVAVTTTNRAAVDTEMTRQTPAAVVVLETQRKVEMIHTEVETTPPIHTEVGITQPIHMEAETTPPIPMEVMTRAINLEVCLPLCNNQESSNKYKGYGGSSDNQSSGGYGGQSGKNQSGQSGQSGESGIEQKGISAATNFLKNKFSGNNNN